MHAAPQQRHQNKQRNKYNTNILHSPLGFRVQGLGFIYTYIYCMSCTCGPVYTANLHTHKHLTTNSRSEVKLHLKTNIINNLNKTNKTLK